MRLAAREMGSWRYDGGSEGGGAGKLDIGGGISSQGRRRPPRRPSNPTGHQQTGFCERGAEFAGRARVLIRLGGIFLIYFKQFYYQNHLTNYALYLDFIIPFLTFSKPFSSVAQNI